MFSKLLTIMTDSSHRKHLAPRIIFRVPVIYSFERSAKPFYRTGMAVDRSIRLQIQALVSGDPPQIVPLSIASSTSQRAWHPTQTRPLLCWNTTACTSLCFFDFPTRTNGEFLDSILGNYCAYAATGRYSSLSSAVIPLTYICVAISHSMGYVRLDHHLG